MIAGFKSDIYCEGIIGDGCGGGRFFVVEDGELIAHEPNTKENIILLKNIHTAKKISKMGCIITIECQNETIKFDLSLLKKV